jgi:hypothetical protein
MLLFNPSPGQIVDRLSILELKLDHASRQAWFAIQGEIKACQSALETKTPSVEKLAVYQVLSYQLREQNKKQWAFENDVRRAIKHLSDPPSYEELLDLCTSAKETHLGNEVRAKLVAQIDALFDTVTEGKIYQ